MTEETQTAESAPVAPPQAESKTSYDGAEIRGVRREESRSEARTEAKPEGEAKPSGYAPVDLDNLPPEVKERVNYLYRQVKDSDRTLREFRRIASDQSRQINELTQGHIGLVSHLQEKSLGDSEEAITTQMNAAFERGDNKAYLDAQRKLIDLGVEKRLVVKQKPQPIQQQQPQPIDASEIANRATLDGNLSPTDIRTTEAWQNEKDENGNVLRPWSKTNDVNNPDPAFVQALTETKAVFTNQRFAHLSYEEKLAEVDRRMGLAKRVTAQTVTGGGLKGNTKFSKVSLSPDIEKMVKHTKWGGKKYKTDDERLDAYRQQLVKVKGTR